MTCGIYLLRFTGTDSVYVGQGIDCEARFKRHIKDMQMGNHTKKLQAAFITYGMPSFEVLIECLPAALDTEENEAIEIFNAADSGFNFNKSAEASPTGKGADSPNATLCKQKYVDILFLLADRPDLTMLDVSQIIGTSYDIVSSISRGHSHKWLEIEYPETYTKVVSLIGTRRTVGTPRQPTNAVISPEGIVYIVGKHSEFARVHNLDESSLSKLLYNKRKTHKGWRLA